MSRVTGDLRKLRAREARPVVYALPVGEHLLELAPVLGRRLRLRFTGRIHCVACGRETRKSFGQGYCFPCFRSLARCDSCIVRPERCHYHAGTCREPTWGEAHCLRPHVVYLASASGPKVGITRATEIPTRWLDQGAVAALPVLEAASRLDSGLAEVALKAHVSDRTDWRRMLRETPDDVDLEALRDDLLVRAGPALAPLERDGRVRRLDAAPRRFEYPLAGPPPRLVALRPERDPEIAGRLLGVKGQYLVLDAGVLNVRRHAGHEVEVEAV